MDQQLTVGEARPLDRWLLIVALALTVGLEFFQNAMLSLAPTFIMGHIGATPEQYTWAVTAYAVISVAVISKTGWFIRHLGFRQYLVTSVLVFTLGAFLSGWLASPGGYIFARSIQALGGGALFTASRITLQAAFRHFRAKAAKFYFYTTFVALFLGPAVAGYIMQSNWWQLIFWLLIPLGGITAALLYMSVPDIVPPGSREDRFGYGAMFLLTLGIGGFQVFAQQVHFEILSATRSLFLLVLVSFLAFTTFFWHQFRHAEPLVNVRVLNRRTFLEGLFLYFSYYFGSNAFSYLYPVFTQALGFGEETIGHTLAISGVAAFTFLVIYYQFLVRRVKNKHLFLMIGFALGFTASFLFSRFSPDVGLQNIVPALILRSLATVFLIAPIPSMTFYELAGVDFAHGYRIKNIVRQLSISIATSSMIIFMQDRSAVHEQDLFSHFSSDNPAFNQGAGQLAQGLAGPAMSPAEGNALALGVMGQEAQRQATLLACSEGFRLIAICFLVFAGIMLLYFGLQKIRSFPATAAPPTRKKPATPR